MARALPPEGACSVSDLTPSQARLLGAIRGYWTVHGFSPSIRDLSKLLGFSSPNAVSEQLRRLRRKGAIRWTDGIARSIVLIQGGRR